VPPPKENFKLFVRHRYNNVSSDWRDFFHEINTEHQRNRLAGYESLLLALSNSLRFYSGSQYKNGIQNDRSNTNFKILEQIVLKYYSSHVNFPMGDTEILICVEHTGTRKTQVYYYPFE
jgi:hypothetical protein